MEEAAYIIRDAGVSTLVTVRGFLGTDYPALLAGQDTADLARIVLLRDADGAGADGAGAVLVGAVPVKAELGSVSPRLARVSIRPKSAARRRRDRA